MSTAVPYDPVDDLNAFYGAIGTGELGRADPDMAHDLIDRVASHPEQASRSMGFKATVPSEVFSGTMRDAFYEESSRDASGVEAANGIAADRIAERMTSISRRTGIPEDEVALSMGDSVAFDRIMEMYYRS